MDEELDNPAGRLHALFERYRDAGAKATRQQAWAAALDVDHAEVPYEIGRVGQLLRDVRAEHNQSDTRWYQSLPHHLDVLAECVFPEHQPFAAPASAAMPDPTAMDMLGAFSDRLHTHASEGVVLDAEQIECLASDARQLTEDVLASDLPPEVKRRVAHCLADVQAALEHMRTGGPEAAEKAVAALIGTAVLYNAGADPDASSKIAKFAQKFWKAVQVTTVIGSGVNTWSELLSG